jgi:alpha-beta hydrolase superfamily lysophospholipase
MPHPLLRRRARSHVVRQPYPRWGEEIALEGQKDETPLLLRVLAPQTQGHSPASLLLVHGMNEYIGRYGAIARHFADRHLVAGFDLPGHGLSNPVLMAADRAIRSGAAAYDAGDAYLAQSALNSLEPMRQALLRALHGLFELSGEPGRSGRAVVILAHSLGALVSASLLLQERHNPALLGRIAGIVFLGPACAVSELPGWRGQLANPVLRLSFAAEERLLSERAVLHRHRLWAKPISAGLNGLFDALSQPRVRDLVTPVAPDWVPDYLTDWEEERERHRADGYIVRRTLLSYVKGIEREIVAFRRRMTEFPVPYLLVHSERDPITAAWGARDFAAATAHLHPDNQALFLAQRYHHEHLFASPDETAAVLERIDEWLEKRLAGWVQG